MIKCPLLVDGFMFMFFYLTLYRDGENANRHDNGFSFANVVSFEKPAAPERIRHTVW